MLKKVQALQHNDIEVSDQVGGGRDQEYVVWSVRIIPYACLLVSRINLRNKWDLGEGLLLDSIRMEQLIAVE